MAIVGCGNAARVSVLAHYIAMVIYFFDLHLSDDAHTEMAPPCEISALLLGVPAAWCACCLLYLLPVVPAVVPACLLTCVRVYPTMHVHLCCARRKVAENALRVPVRSAVLCPGAYLCARVPVRECVSACFYEVSVCVHGHPFVFRR